MPDAASAWHESRSPALKIARVPASAKTLALIVDDPDAVSPNPTMHWLLANLPATTTMLPAALPNLERLATLGGAIQGAAIGSKAGYFGPKPQPGAAHHYHFQLFALDQPLKLPLGFTRDALLAAMQGHVVARGELIGTYARIPP